MSQLRMRKALLWCANPSGSDLPAMGLIMTIVGLGSFNDRIAAAWGFLVWAADNSFLADDGRQRRFLR